MGRMLLATLLLAAVGNAQDVPPTPPPGGGFPGNPDFLLELLTRQLNLSDDQIVKVRELLAKDREERKKLEEARKTSLDAVLSDNQRNKLADLIQNGGPGLSAGVLRFIGSSRPGKQASLEERAKGIVDLLKIDKPDERDALQELVGKVLKAQGEVQTVNQLMRDKLAEDSKNPDLSEAALEDRLKELRESRRSAERVLGEVQKQLGEVLTNRQEVILVLQGVLR